MTDQSLAVKACFACENGTSAMEPAEIKQYLAKVDPAWTVLENQKIERQFKFSDFKAAMKFVNGVADIAESEGHHPDTYIFYNLVRLDLYTHEVNGLSENDFILAAKIDLLL